MTNKTTGTALPLPIDIKSLSNQEIVTILDHIPYPICIMDAEGRTLFVNRSFCEEAGIQPEDILGQSLDYGTKTKLHDRAILYDAMRTKETVSGIVHVRGDRNALVQCVPLRDTNNIINYFVSISVFMDEMNALWTSLQKERQKNTELHKEIDKLRKGLLLNDVPPLFASQAMQSLHNDIKKYAPLDCPVLITGETGSGKDVVAKLLHLASPRSAAPFVALCVPALPESLLESELFGYETGAFTGSRRNGKKGLFEEARDGTLFLDEIGDMPMHMQVKILRALENGEIRHVGGLKNIRCNARIIAATNKDLAHMVAEGTFREDLFYRLNVMRLHVPPLRERTDAISQLIQHLIKYFSLKYHSPKTISAACMARLEAYNWPGNVRELRNTVERLVVLSEGTVITERDADNILPSMKKPLQERERERERERETPQTPERTNAPALSVAAEFQQYERSRLLEALKETNGNKSKAAQLLNMSRSRFYREIEKI